MFFRSTQPQFQEADLASTHPPVGSDQENNVFDEDKRLIHTELMVAKLLAFSAMSYSLEMVKCDREGIYCSWFLY
ncbi:hypothetical protein E3N88_40537 [Mikania micrantha]|uniref:Uncharacterized protein n=1 Tax=Mikania micrantha TaxID=192012 RepID=A0A5N6LMU5_9ASTR|nr:hypothetical protein E3N88_40537 [Mikania micrantha]